jgi:hypothetical protein
MSKSTVVDGCDDQDDRTAHGAIELARLAALDAGREATGAAKEQADAEALIVALQRRVVDGDPDITPAEITAARELSEFAKLRAEGAAVKATEAQKAHRRAQLEELAARLHAHDADPDAFDRALTDVQTALENLAVLADQRRADVENFRDAMQQLGVDMTDQHLAQHTGRPEDLGMTWSVPGAGGGTGVAVAGRILAPVDIGPILRATLAEVSDRHRLGLTGTEIRHVMSHDGYHDLHKLLRSQA